jgi:hypothetical protein
MKLKLKCLLKVRKFNTNTVKINILTNINVSDKAKKHRRPKNIKNYDRKRKLFDHKSRLLNLT